MSDKILKVLTIILASLLVGIVLLMAQGVATSAASPVYNPATTTPEPTEIPEDAYWLGEAAVFTFDMSEGLDQGFDEGWYIEELVGGGSPEFVAPADNYPGGMLITMYWVTYSGDLILQSGSNTNWFQPFNDYWTSGANEMTAGETTCNGTSAACSFAGYSVEAAHDWEGYLTSGDTNYLPSPHVYAQLGGSSGGVAFRLQPIFYGIEDEHCWDDLETLSEPFAEGEIDATLEDGVDEDLAEGGSYAVEIFGGPWDDGTDARYDVAYSWDGEEWEPLDGSTEDAGCVDYQADGSAIFYIEAQSDTLYMRVNDEADEFDDNADEMEYKIYGVVGSGETGCGAYYTLGTKVFDESWDATFNDWQYPSSKSWPGLVDEDCCYFENYDVYRILIPHTYGDGSLYNAEAQIRPQLGGSWQDLATHPQTVCVEDHDTDTATQEGWVAYYFESPEDFTSYEIRAADLDGDHDAAFDNNSGGFEVEVYTAAYNPPVAGCANTFDTGPLIQTIRVDSMAQNGIRIPDPLYAYMRDDEGGLLAGTSYMIEEPSTWAGFTSLDGSSLWQWQISADRSTWWDIENFAACIQPIDAHHNKYYFDAASTEYYIRAKDYDGDGSWQDQPGFISLNLYYADDLRASPDANGSCPNLQLGDSLYSGSVSSTDLEGGFLPDILTPGALYGIQLTTPAWTDNGVDQKAAQIKLSGTGDWEDFEGWEGAFCSETDGNDWPLNWIQAADARYLLRADDSIEDNSGWVNYTIYEADWITDPIYPSCEGDYNPALFADFPILEREIPAHWQHGQLVQDFVLRQGTYKITTSQGPWGDAGFEGYVMSYDLEISVDGGAANTWVDLDEAAVCVVPIDTDGHIRAYIEIPEGYDNLVRLRADNQDALWIDNTGSMYMDLQYSAQIAGEAIDPDAPWDPYADEDGMFQSGGCNLKCVSPGGSLSVPAWLEYFRCMLVIRLSFCPYHIDVLKSMRDLFYDREPFGSLQELGQSFGLVRDRVDSYQWSEDQGGDPPDIDYPENFIFASPDGGGANIPLVGDDTIWGSGEIDIQGSGETFDLTCNNNLAASLGDRLSQPLCFTFNVIDSLGLSSWFQFFWDLSMLIALSMYFQNRWLKPMSS